MSAALPRLKLGFAGTPQFAVPALDALCRAHQVCAVFTQPDRPAGRGQPLHMSPVKQRALELGLSLHQPLLFKSAGNVQLLRELALDALVVVAYGQILPSAALECPRLGCLNIHASLLPRWRGAAPIQRAVLAGDVTTGVTIMRMDAGLDTGPILAARAIDIAASESAQSLHDRLSVQGAHLLCETLDRLAHGRLSAVPQPALGASYADKINKAEAAIDWRQDAAQVWRQIRAFNPWPVAETRLNGAQVRIWEAQLNLPCASDPHEASGPAGAREAREAREAINAAAQPGSVLAATPQGIDVACGSGELRILRLQLAGRKAMCAREFIKAQPLRGVRFASL